MDQREKITRLRQIIIDAVRRGHAQQTLRVRTQVPYPIRRRHLLARVSLKMKHHDMRDEVDAFVYETGHQSLQGLALDQLEVLDGWLTQCVEDQQIACDPRNGPPAR